SKPTRMAITAATRKPGVQRSISSPLIPVPNYARPEWRRVTTLGISMTIVSPPRVGHHPGEPPSLRHPCCRHPKCSQHSSSSLGKQSEIEPPVAIRAPVRKETESTDHVAFDSAPCTASVNILAAAVRTNLPAEVLRTHRGRR